MTSLQGLTLAAFLGDAGENYRVTVAAYGPAFMWHHGLFVGDNFEDQGPAVPYAERKKAVLDVFPDESLGAVIDRAAAVFGVAPAPRHGNRMSEVVEGVVFYKPEDEAGVHRPEPWPGLIRLVDQSGSPSWSVPWSGVRYHELLQSSRAGLVEGDPFRPYLWPVIPQGEPVTITIFVAFWLLDKALGGIVEDVASREARRLWSRVRGVRQLTESAEWRDRLARPDAFVAYMRRQRRTSEEAAALLHSSINDAEAVLWGMGFAFDEGTGTWVWAGDREAAILADALERARTCGTTPTEDEIRTQIEDAPPR